MMTALSNQQSQEIKIGAVTIMGIGYVPRMVNHFYELHPGKTYSINIEQQASSIQSSLLKQGQCEIAFGPYIEDPDIEIKELYKEQVRLAVSKHHALSRKRTVSFENFAHEKVVTFLKPAGIRKQIDNYFASHNAKPNILYEVTNEIMVAGIVESVDGVALLPCSDEESFSNIRLIPIIDSKMSRPLYIMRLKNVPLKSLANEFWDFVVGEADKKSTPSFRSDVIKRARKNNAAGNSPP